MTNRNAFDEHVKKQLENLSPEVPQSSWDKILQAQQGQRRKGFFYHFRENRWIQTALILILVLSGLLIFRNQDQPDFAMLSNSASAKDAPTASDSDPEHRTASGPTHSQIQKTEPVSVSQQQDNSNAQIILDQTAQPKQQVVDKSNALQTLASQDQHSNVHDALIKQKTASGGELMQITAHGNRSSKRSVKGNSIVSVEAPDTDQEIKSQEKFESSSTESDAVLTKTYLAVRNDAENADAPNTVTGIALQPLSIPCPGSGKKGLASCSYLEVYGGPDYVFRTFSDTASSTYLKQRKETTRFTSAFSFGVRYTHLFKGGFSIRTVINFSQINERFKYQSGQVLQNVFIVNEQGDTTGSYAATTSRYKVTHNRYRTLDVPLLIGYEMGGERFRLNVNAGPVINIYSWQKGDILGRDNQPVNITTGKSNSAYNFKTNAGVGIMGAASLYHKWRGNLYFLAEPWFRYNFSAANKADITLKQKFTTTGLRLGIRMNL